MSHLQFVLTCLTFLIASPSDAVSQTVNAGQLLFNNACRTCHTVKEGDNRLGPNLYKILGRKAGSVPNYAYSSAMRSADFVWDKEKIDRFIENPDTVVPGNKMKPYDGLASADRAKVIFIFGVTDERSIVEPDGRGSAHRRAPIHVYIYSRVLNSIVDILVDSILFRFISDLLLGSMANDSDLMWGSWHSSR